MLCDMCGAGQAYNRASWTPREVLAYYNKRYYSDNAETIIINSSTRELFELLLHKLVEFNNMTMFLKWYKRSKNN